MSLLHRLFRVAPTRVSQRAGLALVLACGISLVVSVTSAKQRNLKTTARLNSAAQQLDSLTVGTPADDNRRAAIAWGYAERLRAGLESPFRLIEAAGSDPRLTTDERRTVAWALLARIVRGESHAFDAAALDGLGPADAGHSVAGEQHANLIEETVRRAENPRAAELAVRLAYTLAVAERLVDGSAPLISAEAAAMMADRELARREARDIVRSATGQGVDPVQLVKRRRARRAFYVERPVLLAPSHEIERDAIVKAATLLHSLRRMRPVAISDSLRSSEVATIALAPRLFAAGALLPPAAPLAVTVQRYLPLIRAQVPHMDHDALARTRNGEMLVAVTRLQDRGRPQRRAIGRLMLAAGVAMRSLAQEPAWFPMDTAVSETDVATQIGVSTITFDRDVPMSWRPYYLWTLGNAIRDMRRVLPALQLDALHVRFRMDAPADSALAMHDPRTRTLHLPVLSAGGTLSHELAHDLDRQSALQQGLPGYRSDLVARAEAKDRRGNDASSRLAASLRALTEELSELPRAVSTTAERPAEIFATRVDWFIASGLARQGISSGFLSAVQDELLTGHVVHPERLRSSGRSRSLATALEAMTSVAPSALQELEPSAQTLLRWSLAGPVDRRVAAEILRDVSPAWTPTRLIGKPSCEEDLSTRATLVRMAAESRARGWLRLRARWTIEVERPAWARSTLRQGPWNTAIADQRITQLRDYILVELASSSELPAGLSAYAASLAAEAGCAKN
jgi:hypothetical protein